MQVGAAHADFFGQFFYAKQRIAEVAVYNTLDLLEQALFLRLDIIRRAGKQAVVFLESSLYFFTSCRCGFIVTKW